jgi:transcriptional/translational regulatory protein YebC/TACO1
VEELRAAGFSHSRAEITRVPDATVSLDPETTQKALKLIGKLDDLDDVQSVSTNLDIPDDFDPSTLE